MIVNESTDECLRATFVQMDGDEAVFLKGGLPYRINLKTVSGLEFIPVDYDD